MEYLFELLKNSKTILVSITDLCIENQKDPELHALYETAVNKGMVILPGIIGTEKNTYEVVFGDNIITYYKKNSICQVPCILLSEKSVSVEVKKIWNLEHDLLLASCLFPRNTNPLLMGAAELLKCNVSKKDFIKIFQYNCQISKRHARDYYKIASSNNLELIENRKNLCLHDLVKKV